ncbi:MAG: DUF1295 domain-containing protein [Beijerinckiaceae bacterium]
MATVMAIAWMVQRRTGNSGWIDMIWSLGTGIVSVVLILLTMPKGSTRGWLVAGLVALWAMRLGLHIFRRAQSSTDDPRYAALMKEWGTAAPVRLFWFLQSQAIAGAILAFSVALAAGNPEPFPMLLDYIAATIAALAVYGEWLADRQLRKHNDNKHDKPTLCDEGLWAWSRHPNYFFEFLYWTSIPLFAIAGGIIRPMQWVSILAPAMMYWLLRHVSGVPPLEAHMLRTRGMAFENYQKRVSIFFPRPPA